LLLPQATADFQVNYLSLAKIPYERKLILSNRA